MIVSMTGQLVPIVLEKPFPQAHLLKICLLNCDNSINRILLSWKMKCFWQSKGVWPQDAIHVLSNGQNDRFGQGLYHRENVRVPALRRLAYLPAYLWDVLVDVVEKAGEVRDNAARENLLYPVRQRVFEELYAPSPPAPRIRARGENLAFISRTGPRAAAQASCRWARHRLRPSAASCLGFLLMCDKEVIEV